MASKALGRLIDVIKGIGHQPITMLAVRLENVVRTIAREEIEKARAEIEDRRRKMLEDIRAGRPVDAFVNRGDNPHGNPETEQ